MKQDEVKDKLKNMTEQMSLDKIKDFLNKNWKYIAAVILFLVLIVVMVRCSGSKQPKDANLDTESTQLEAYQEDTIPQLNELITNYYTAYAAGDVATIQNYATPVTENEQSFITMFSQYIEGYQNIKCYTKTGLDDKSYLVSVYLEMKFAGIDTVAPGLEFFYVRTNEDGNLYIDNLYSNYNRNNSELATDTSISALITQFQKQEDVIALQTEVQTQYEAAIASDANLAAMVNTTIADAYSTWRASITAATPPAETEQPTTEQPTTEQPVTDQPATEVTPEVTTETVYTTDKVNVRQEPNATAASLGMVDTGTALTRTGTTEDGWSIIDYNGTQAYVKSEYLSTEAPAAETTDQSSGIAEGTTVTLTNTVNIRSSMSETASKVGVAYAGDTITVVMSYAEGWTKVTWKNQTGYAKTEFIK